MIKTCTNKDSIKNNLKYYFYYMRGYIRSGRVKRYLRKHGIESIAFEIYTRKEIATIHACYKIGYRNYRPIKLSGEWESRWQEQ